MTNISNLATIKIHRKKSGFLKVKPAIVLFDNQLIQFFQGDTKEFFISPGITTLTLNKKKHLTFQIQSDDIKEFEIKEAITDWKFCVKYGILLLFILLLLIGLITELINGKKHPSGIIGLLCAFWAMSEVRHQYFYLEEQ